MLGLEYVSSKGNLRYKQRGVKGKTGDLREAWLVGYGGGKAHRKIKSFMSDYSLIFI